MIAYVTHPLVEVAISLNHMHKGFVPIIHMKHDMSQLMTRNLQPVSDQWKWYWSLHMSFIWLTTVASCVRPRSIRNGRVSGRDFGHGKTVSYRCDGNYALEGSSTLTCDDGRWNPNPPVCRGQSEVKWSLIVTQLTIISLRIPVSTGAERGKSSLVATHLANISLRIPIATGAKTGQISL